MANEELAQAQLELKKIGADWALLSSHENVTYVSHYEVPIDFGPLAHLNFGPVLALFSVANGESYLIANNYYAGGAKKQTTFDEVFGFGILEVFDPYNAQDPRSNFVKACRKAFKEAGLNKGKLKLAVEARTIPFAVTHILMDEFPDVEVIEGEPAIILARSIKTEREIELLKDCAEVVNVGQKELMKQ